MAASTTLTISTTGVGTSFPGQFHQLGLSDTKLRQRKNKIFAWLNPNRELLLRYKRLSQIPTSKKMKFKNCSFALEKEAEDSYLSDVNEDTEEMYDELFKKHGQVVFKSDDKRSPIAEVDSDAESLSFAVELAKVASDVKAGDIKVLFVKPLVYWTRFFIIATAFSRPQIEAIRSRVRDLAEEKYGRVPTGDSKPNSWTLLDFGDVVVHIFLPPQREYYNLEEFYGNAKSIQLPSENQPPFRN